MKPTLHLLMGLPGSGKTSLGKIIQKLTKAVRLSSDDYRLLIFPEPTFTQKEHDNLYGILDHNVEHLLQADHDVIYDANLNRRIHREEKYAMAKKYDANVVLWYLSTAKTMSKKRRLEEQNYTLVPEGESPELMFDRIADIIEPPGKDEKHIDIDGTDIKTDDVKKLIDSIG